MSKLEGIPFQNSETCKGVAYSTEGAPIDFAEITITGTYPEEGWAVNRDAHEMVRVHRGAGSLALKETGEIQLLQGDVVHVPPQTAFAWNVRDDEMILHMSCSPPFSPEQYEIIEEENI